MRVVSGRMGRERVHFEAPPRKRLRAEVDAFLAWWAAPPTGLDGVVRAGIAHLWFVTIHPFEDGNGRLARAITDMALARTRAGRCGPSACRHSCSASGTPTTRCSRRRSAGGST